MRFVNYHHITIIAAIVIIASGYAVSSDVNVVDVIADIMFTPILDAAYAVHGALLSLDATFSITDDDDLVLGGAWGITTFVSGGHTYAAVAASADHGVQILNITDPLNITAAGQHHDNSTLKLTGVRGITTFVSDGHTYAAVTSNGGGSGVQILDVTNPPNITAAGNLDDLPPTVNLKSAYGIATFVSEGHTYAAVASPGDHGVQILNITDPLRIIPTDRINDDDHNNLELEGASGITTFVSGGHTYAAVAASVDHGVQILNITNPSSIATAGNITDSNSLVLAGAEAIAIFESGNHTYAAVASYTESGVQILNITNPYSITAAGNIIGNSTNGLVLAGAAGITTFKSDNHTYAAVASYTDAGVQILDVTNPYSITAAGNITGTSDTNGLALRGATGITTFESGGYIYLAVASNEDHGVQIISSGITRPDTTPPVVIVGEDTTQSRKRSSSSSTPAVDLASLQSLGYMDSNGTKTPHDPFAPIAPMNTDDPFHFAMAINGMHYLLGGTLNTLEPQTLLTGIDNTISFAVYDRADIAHFTLYMNLHGQDTDYQDSDTYITYDMGNIRIVDPHDLISNATVSIKTSGADSLRHIVVFVITFEGEMEQTNLVARTWNTGASFTIVHILNAFDVSTAPPDTQPALSEDPMSGDPVSDVMSEPEDSGPAGTAPDPNAVKMIIRTWSGI